MASLLLSKCIFPVLVAGSGGETNLLNLYTPDPKEVTGIPAGGDSLAIDLGAAYDVDWVFIGFIGGAATFNFDPSNNAIFAGSSFGALTTNINGVYSAGPVGARRRHIFVRSGIGVVNSRYWEIYGLPASAAYTIGVLAFGKGIQPAWGHEWGAGRFVDDRSVTEPLSSGGWGVDKRAIVPGWQFTCGDLTDAELAALWEMAQDVGSSRPLLVAEDPAATQPALNLGLHYGLFSRPEAYERLVPGASRWAFRVTEWI